jgi:hypothetical protein
MKSRAQVITIKAYPKGGSGDIFPRDPSKLVMKRA